MSLKDIKAGNTLIENMKTMDRKELPMQPRPQRRVEYPPHQAPIEVAKQNHELSDHGLVIQAYINAIVSSDHPMIMEELKRLYMLAKLTIPADDPYLNSAFKTVRETDDENRRKETEDAQTLSRWQAQVDDITNSKTIALKNISTWWNDIFLPEMTIQANRSKTNPWYKGWLSALKDHQGNCGVDYPHNWKTLKDYTWLRTENWKPNDITLMWSYFENVYDRVEEYHCKYVDKIFNEICEKIWQSNEVQQALKGVEDKADQITRYYRNDYNNRYDSPWPTTNRYGLDQYERMRDGIDLEVQMYRRKVEEAAHREVYARHLKGEEGLEIVYWEPKKSPPLNSNAGVLPGSVKTKWRDRYGNTTDEWIDYDDYKESPYFK